MPLLSVVSRQRYTHNHHGFGIPLRSVKQFTHSASLFNSENFAYNLPKTYIKRFLFDFDTVLWYF